MKRLFPQAVHTTITIRGETLAKVCFGAMLFCMIPQAKSPVHIGKASCATLPFPLLAGLAPLLNEMRRAQCRLARGQSARRLSLAVNDSCSTVALNADAVRHFRSHLQIVYRLVLRSLHANPSSAT